MKFAATVWLDHPCLRGDIPARLSGTDDPYAFRHSEPRLSSNGHWVQSRPVFRIYGCAGRSRVATSQALKHVLG